MRDRYASLREGLVGAWIPSVSGSGLLLPDLSGQGNNGTLTNMGPEDWVSGQYGRALDFDGVNDYVVIGDVLDSVFVGTSAKFSIASWAHPASTEPGNVVAKIADSNFPENQRQFSFRYRLQALEFAWYGALNAASFRVIASTETIPLTTWTHVAVTFNASIANPDQKASLFINGNSAPYTLAFTAGTPVSIQNGTASLAIGASVNTGGTSSISRFPGQLDDVRIYNRVLSESEIKLLSQEPGVGFKRTRSVFDFGRKPAYLPPTPTDYRTVRVKQTEHASLREGLVGAWCPSIEGSGYTLPDLSGQGNNGTLTNMGPEDWVAGEYGRALDFDGVNDKVADIGQLNSFSFIQNTGIFTISFWAKFDTDDTRLTVLGNNPASASKGFFVIREYNAPVGNNAMRFVSYRGVSNTFVVTGTTNDDTALAGQWNHWCFASTYQNNIGQWYLNGIAVTTTSKPNTLVPGLLSSGDSTRTLSIGVSTFTSDIFPLDGQLDDVRIYNRVLSEPEIKLLASRPGIGLRPQRRTMYYAPPTGARRRRILTSMP